MHSSERDAGSNAPKQQGDGVNRTRLIRAGRLIDGLINGVHHRWPGAAFIIKLPTGEELLVPRHGAGATECTNSHSSYFRLRVLPYCEVNPTPRLPGKCTLRPVVGIDGGAYIPAYSLDLGSGLVTEVERSSNEAAAWPVIGSMSAAVA